jgi:hypothetical protein
MFQNLGEPLGRTKGEPKDQRGEQRRNSRNFETETEQELVIQNHEIEGNTVIHESFMNHCIFFYSVILKVFSVLTSGSMRRFFHHNILCSDTFVISL